MKNFELMKILSEQPAGANVEFVGNIDIRKEAGEAEEIDKNIYSFRIEINNADYEGKTIVLSD